MTRKKFCLKQATIETEDYPCQICFHRIHAFAAILLGFCAAQIALVRQKYPGTNFTVKDYRKKDKISKADKDTIADVINRKRRMQRNKVTREIQTEIFMRTFNVDMDKEEYTREDLIEFARRMAASTNIGLSIFKKNCFTQALEHMITPVKCLPYYINIVEVDYDRFKYFESDNALGFSFFCHECGKSEEQRAFHRCTASCHNCNRSNTLCKNGTEKIYCPDCNIVFYTNECFIAHKTGSKNGAGNRCSAVKNCTNCLRFYQTRFKHNCDEYGRWCEKCKKKHKKGQVWCNWTPLTPEQKENKIEQQTEYKFAVYDIEAVQGKMYRDPADGYLKTKRQVHYANVIVVRMWCHLCEDKGRLEHCENCGDRERVIRYDNAEDHPDKVINEFRDFIINDPTTKERTFFAHNAARYDNQMVLQSFVKGGLFPTTIMDGYAVIKMKLELQDRSVYFKDSYKLIPCPVADMPKNFKLTTGLKGTFPYLFNRPENYGTTTQGLPHDDYFGVLTEKKKKELKEYREGLAADYKFIFDEEIVKYCKQDVVVVQEAIMSYRKEVMGVTGWCPFSISNTVASYVLHVLVNNFAPCDEMIYLPEIGVSGRRINQSEMAMKWLLWKQEETGKPIQSAMNKGEYRIPGTILHVDGYDGEKVYEVLGCYWHGCFCMGEDTVNAHTKTSMRQLHEKSQLRIEKIRSLGYEVEVVRECEIKEKLREDPIMAQFFKKTCVKQYSPLIPRDGVQGGRTENFRFRVVPGPNEKVRYLDIVSLYPYVMYDNEYPLGAPEIITNFTGVDLNGPIPWKGLLKVKILPPKNLRIPVLGYSCNNMLVFPLCRTCSEEANLKDPCTHNDEERTLIGTYTHAELQKAVDRGYKLQQYYEVWSWNKWTRDMYKEFINIFLKMKVEATGWGDADEAKKAAIIAEYREKLGIEIDPNNVRSSPGRRYIAKLMLNTLWGKMCQRDDLVMSSYTKRDEVFDKWEYRGYKVHKYSYITPDVLFTIWKPIHEMRTFSNYAALHHAAFVTSYGRLRLYDIMEKAVKGLMYCDTDSVMFLAPKDLNPLEAELTGFFGFLSDEIEPDEEVTGVTIVAPKAYMVEKTKADGTKMAPIVKSKGIQQNTETSDKLVIDNYNMLAESRVRTALSGNDEDEFTVSVQQTMIKKTRTLDLTTEHFTKVISAKSKKGAIRGTNALDAHRVPYGFLE